MGDRRTKKLSERKRVCLAMLNHFAGGKAHFRQAGIGIIGAAIATGAQHSSFVATLLQTENAAVINGTKALEGEIGRAHV